MALAGMAVPFGLRQVDLTPLGAGGDTPGTPVLLPISRRFKFAETEDSEELRGDDAAQYNHGSGLVVEWELEAGGIDLEAYVVMAGGAITSSGVTPNVIKTYSKLVTDNRPYFRVRGRSINDNGGDFKAIVYRCKATDSLEGELADQSFWLTSASGKGYGSLEAGGNANKAYDFIHSETAAALV